MKRILSALIAVVLVLSMIPAVSAAESEIITSGTNVAATAAAPVTYTWTPATNGTLTVTMGAASPGWRYTIFDASGNTVGLPQSGKTEKSADFELVGGMEYTFSATGFNSSWDVASANITYTLSFLASEETGGEIEKAEYEVSETALILGDNSLTLLETAYTTIFVFEPTETGVYTITAPEGAILGYWGAGSWFLSNPNSTTNTYEYTCTGVGQSAYIGISGIEGTFNVSVVKTGDYEVVEIPIVLYENKATLSNFTLPEGSILGGYIDVTSESVYTAVLGEDGYYHLNSADGDIILVDMDYQDIILSNALLSDRPVMYAYTTDENGNKVKYDIGEAIKEYEQVMDANGYYPLTEDLILFYDVYANGAAVYTFYVTSNYNQDNVWMYCMRTVTFPEETEPSEPEVTEPEVTEPEVTEPEVTEPEVTEPEVTEPEVTEPEITEPEATEPSEPAESEPEVTEPSEPLETVPGTIFAAANAPASESAPITHTWVAESNGTLTVTMDATPGWRYEITDAAGNTIGLAKTGSTKNSADFTLEAGTTYTFTATGYEFTTWGPTEANLTYSLVFVADNSGSDVQKAEYEVSQTSLSVGSNTLTLLDTAITTVYKFKPTEAGTYTFTAPAGTIVGNWGSNVSYLINPNSTTNSCQWTCTSVGQSVYIGVSAVSGSFVLSIAKSETTEPEVTEPEATEPEASEPVTSEPEVSEPEITVPEVGENVVFTVTENGNTENYEYGSEIISAITSVQGNATVIVYKDIDLGSSFITVNADKSIILDLNGCTITNNKTNGAVISVSGTLTVQDSSVEGDGLIKNTATSSDRGILVNSTGVLYVISGNINSKTQAIRVDSGKMTMTGGNVSATQYGIYGGGTSNVTIRGGKVSVATGTYYHAVFGGGSATMSITGGYFVGGALKCSGLIGSISGGYFTTAPAADMIAANCEVQENNDSVYLYKVVDPTAVPEEPSEPEQLVDTWNLVLDDDLLVNFCLNLTDDAQVQVSVGDQIITYSASELEVNANGKYIVSVRLAAAQMTESISLQIVGSDAEAVSYTVRQYADTILSDNDYSAYHSLVKQLLSYGAAAQNYFGYNTENLADAGITDVAANEVPAEAYEIVVSGKVSDVAYAGATLVYRDKIAVRLYFTGDVTGLKFTANGKTYAPVAKDDMYYIEIADILPQNLDQQITLTVTDADGNALSVTYGPMNYIVRMSTKGSEELKVLLKALYNYHLAAKALRAA